MNAEDFAKTWGELVKEKAELSSLRNNLETELVEVKTKIAHLEEVLNHLAPLAGLPYVMDEEDVSQFGITDAIRSVLKFSGEKMSARDVRDRLIEKGYDLTGLSAPMASIYKILSRLVDDSEEVEREREEGGRVNFQWKRQVVADEYIPL
jgi:hypothetical protein